MNENMRKIIWKKKGKERRKSEQRESGPCQNFTQNLWSSSDPWSEVAFGGVASTALSL